MNLYIVQASIRFHSWDFARKTLWPFLARSKLKTFPSFYLFFFFLTNNLSHTILSCELIIEHSVFVWRVEIFLSESFHVSSEMTKRSWLFFLPSKIEKKNGKQLFRCHEKCSWDKRRSEHVQHVCGQREAVNFTLMFLRLLIHVSSNSSLNLFHPTVGSLKSEKSKR